MKTKSLPKSRWLVTIILLSLCLTDIWAASTTYTMQTSGSGSTAIETNWTANKSASFNASGAYWACGSATNTFTITSGAGVTGTITKVQVTGKRNKDKAYTIDCKVGSTALGSQYSHAASSGNYDTGNTFSNATGLTGTITITVKASGGTATADKGSFWITSIVVTTASCGEPTAPTKGSVNASSQTVSWTAPASAPAGGYYVAYSTATSTTPGDNVYATSGNYTVIAVAAGTTTANIPCNTAGTYNWWVRSKCSSSDNSSCSGWVAGTAFTMKQIYLKINDNWAGDNAKFCAYYWVGSPATKEGFTKIMTNQTDCESGIKTCVFPTDYSNIIFVRLNNTQSDPVTNWDKKWNQTGNLSLASDKNYYQITGGTGDAVTGSWGTYAQKVTVSFDKNTSANGVTDPADQCVVKSTGKATEPTISNMSYGVLGKELDGWYTAASGGSKITFSSQTYTADTELHAHWKDGATTTIALDPTWSTYDWRSDNCVIFAHFYIEGTTQAQDVQMIGNSCDDILIAYAPYGATHVAFARCKSGTSSLGADWDTDANIYNYVNGLAIAANYQYSITGWGSGKVGTAQKESSAYTPTTYTISYNAGTTAYTSGNAISGSKANQSKSCDIDFTLPSSVVFTTTGYTQDGWATSNGGAKAYNLGGTYTTNSAQTFYPHWAAKTMTVTLDNQGATTAGAASVTGTYGSGLPSIAANKPAKTGYNFQGYFASTGGSGTRYIKPDGTADSNWDKEVATTIYAYWTAKTTTVSFNQNSGTGGQSSALTATYGSAMPAISGTPTRSGYLFGGYYDGTGGTGTQYYTAAGTSARNWDKESATATLYARWYGDPLAWCEPDITITGDIHLTSYKDIYVHSTSGAGNLIEISSSDFGSATHVEVAYLDADNSDAEVDKEQSVFRLCNNGSVDYNTIDGFDPDYAWGTTHSIKYTPNAYNKYDNYKLQLKIFNGDSIIKTVTHNLYGRALPEKFVIAVKNTNNNEWYALPNTMGDNADAQTAIVPEQIFVDNTTTPTKATFASKKTVYKGLARNTATSNVNGIRLTPDGFKKLRIISSKNYLYLPTSNSDDNQVWYLKSSNFGAYQIAQDPSHSPSKKLGLYNNSGVYFGYAASPFSYNIYLLPIENEYTDIDAEVTDWTGDDLQVTAAGAAGVSAAKMKVMLEGGSESSAITLSTQVTNTYLAKFDGGYDFTGKSGQTLMLKWLNSSGTMVGASMVTMPKIIVTSATSWASISPTPTIDDIVVLTKPTTIGATGKAKRVELDQTGTNTGALEISAGKELIVAETVRKFDGSSFGATGESDINFGSTSALGLGALVMGTHNGTNKATVNFYSKSHGAKNSNESVNQFVGTPFKDETNVLYNWYNSWIYEFTNTSGTPSWKRIKDGDGMTPFHGYCIISADNEQNPGHMYWQQGTLVASEDQDLTLAYYNSENTENMFANSWMAPIKISAMNGNMDGTTGTVYIFNSGSAEDGRGNKDDGSAGNYSSYTPGTAGSNVIPAMQAFTVYANAADGTLNLDYSAYVYDPAVAGTTPVANKAPQRTGAADEMEHLKLRVASESGWGDALDIYIREDFSDGFELYYDGPKIEGDDLAPLLYAVTDDGKMAINCVPDAEGTVVGFRRGEDAYYLFTFDYDGDEVLYLNDLKEQVSTPISADMSYQFFSAAGDMQTRFIISCTPIRNTPTGVEDTDVRNQKSDVRKLVIDDHVFIIRNGQMYDVTGKRVTEINK